MLHLLFILGMVCAPVLARVAPYVVNGAPVNPRGRWPWQASFQFRSSNSHTCGASLVDSTHVITAAHCVGSGAAAYHVVLGLHQLSNEDSGTQQFNAQTISVHPNYIESGAVGYPNDVAVVQMAGAANTNMQYIKIGPMAPTGSSHVGEDCWISGWGLLTGSSTTLPDTLQEASVRVLTQAECTSIWGSNYIQDNHICILGNGATRGACSGDSGGPLNCLHNGVWVVAGVTSWVRSGCDASWPSVYGGVGHHNAWIDSVIP